MGEETGVEEAIGAGAEARRLDLQQLGAPVAWGGLGSEEARRSVVGWTRGSKEIGRGDPEVGDECGGGGRDKSPRI